MKNKTTKEGRKERRKEGKGKEGGMGSSCLPDAVSVWGDGNILGTGNGDSYTT